VRVASFAFAGTIAIAIATAASSGCGSHATGASSPEGDPKLDPATCANCHADHYRAWSGSMHAYAGDDPVFVAMNARGQRETGGALGTFCVQCHAPMAVRLGLTKDGTDLAKLPSKLRGVTCFFCHSVDAVQGTHDAPMHLATDGAMHASIADPIANDAHPSAYSTLHDRAHAASTQLCGSCHDVTTTANVDVERTFAEWRGSIFAHDDGKHLRTCGNCHMPETNGVAANVAGAPMRRVHDHAMPGADVALTPFAETEAQRTGVQTTLDPAISARLCVTSQGTMLGVELRLDNALMGHDFPSGASHDRRAWAEVIAYAAGQTIFQSGVVADGQSVTALVDPQLFLLRERLLDANGADARFMWQASSFAVASLPPKVTDVTSDPTFDRSVAKSWLVDASADRVTARVRMIPIGLDVVDDLVASGDLDPALRARVPVFELRATVLEWTSARGVPSCLP
jgi:hypothetical protein